MARSCRRPMEFDHLPSSEKHFDLAQAWRHSLEDVIAEVKKCEVVCANCHRARTMARGRSLRRRSARMEQALLFAG